MPLSLEVTAEQVTAWLSGEIDHHAAIDLRRQIDEAVLAGPPPLLVLDFGGVTFMDSSGIGLIMGRCRLMQESGGRLLVIRALRSGAGTTSNLLHGVGDEV